MTATENNNLSNDLFKGILNSLAEKNLISDAEKERIEQENKENKSSE